MSPRYNFENFAQTTEYRRVNRKMIARWISIMSKFSGRKIERILDIATGIGTMIRIFLDELPEELNHPQVICLDKSEGALTMAAEKLSNVVGSLGTIHSPIQDMEVDMSFSVVLWGNGIHNLSRTDQGEAVRRIAKTLDPGGWFFFNSAFYEESRPEDSLSFYRYQVKQAVKILRDRDVSRDRGGNRAEAAKYHPKDYYRGLAESAGLKVKDVGEVTAPLYRRAWETISSFRNYASGALHGYPVEEAQSALRDAVGPALEKYGKKDDEGNLYIPRRWLTIAATKTDE